MIIVDYLRQAGHKPRGIVHVGASLGHEMEAYIQLGPEVIAWVEADQGRFDVLQANASRAALPGAPRQICIKALVGDSDDATIEFRAFNNGDSSSIFPATDLLRSIWPGLDETGEVLSMQTHRMDTLLSKAGMQPADADVLVIDVQGAELMVLRGAGEYLKAARFLEVELSTIQVYKGAPLAHELDAYLTDAGFTRETPIHAHGDTIYRRAE